MVLLYPLHPVNVVLASYCLCPMKSTTIRHNNSARRGFRKACAWRSASCAQLSVPKHDQCNVNLHGEDTTRIQTNQTRPTRQASKRTLGKGIPVPPNALVWTFGLYEADAPSPKSTYTQYHSEHIIAADTLPLFGRHIPRLIT